MGASAPDVAGAAALAAVPGDWGEADDHGGLFRRQGADLGEADDERDRGDGSDAGDGDQDGQPPGEARVGADQGLDFRAEVFDRRFSRAELTFDLDRRRPSRRRAELVEESGSGGDRGVAAAGELLEGLHELAPRRGGVGLEAFAQDRQHSAVDAVGLGQSAPMTSANGRERNGLTTATAKPSAWRLRWAAR